MRKLLLQVLMITFVLVFMGTMAIAGLRDRSSLIELYGDRNNPGHYINIPAITAPSGNPDTNYGWIYYDGTHFYFENSGGTQTDLIAGATTAWDDIGNPDANDTITFGTYTAVLTGAHTAADGFTIQNTGDFGNISILKVQQTTGNPTDGTVLEVISGDTDADALVVTANSINSIVASGDGTINIGGNQASTINFAEFDVSNTTGAVTINDNGDAGFVSVEGSVFNINTLGFTGAGTVSTGATYALTLDMNSGNVAGEDLIITAHNIQLTATGAVTLSPDAAVTTAVTITDTDYTNALSVGDNNILGTTGQINYTSFDVNVTGAGNVEVGGDLTVTGTASLGTLAQDNLVPASASPHAITLNGAGTGKVQVGNSSTGNIELGGATAGQAVDVLATSNLVVSEGDLAITSTANEDMVTVTNNTLTDKSLFLGVSTSLTTGKAISVTTDGITSGTMLYLDNDQGGSFTGKYIQCYDGTGNDFDVALHGVTTIAGSAGNDSLTLTTGDVQVTAGDIDVDAGMITVDAASSGDRSYFYNSGDIGAVGASTAQFSIRGTIAGGNTTNAMHLLELAFNADGDAQDGYLVCRDNAYANAKFAVTAGGTSVWTLDAASYLQLDADTAPNTNTAGVLDLNLETATNGGKAADIHVELENGATLAYGVYVEVDDDTSGAEVIHCFSADETGGGTNATIKGFYAANDVTDAFEAVLGAACQGLVIDATTTLNTNTGGGLMDLAFRSATDGAQAINIDVENDVVGGANETVTGIRIQLDDDSNTGTDTTYGLHVSTDGNGTGLQNALYVDGTGIDAALWACTGYVRIGTGSTPDVTPADDDLYVEGTAEIDGDVRLDGLVYTPPMTESFTTEGDMTDPLTSEVVLLEGDNDADNDTIDIQNGTYAGQKVYLVAHANIDADDTFTLNFGDTTATNAPAVVFNKVGENALLTWTGATIGWVVVSVQDAL